MKNFQKTGDVITVTAPYALTSGDGCLVGAIFGVATNTAANGASVEIIRKGQFSITALSTDTGTPGTKWYWDNTNKRLTTTASGNTLVGAGVGTKTNGQTVVDVLLDGCIR